MKPSTQERFEALYIPEPTSGCFLWTGAVTNTYRRKPVEGCSSSWRPVFRFDGKALSANRASWQIYRGMIPPGAQICHHCDNSYCVNPDHLYAGTRQTNLADMVARGRSANGNVRGTHCPQGHPYNEENMRWRKCRGKPQAVCRICAKEYQDIYKKSDSYLDWLVRRNTRDRQARHLKRTAITTCRNGHPIADNIFTDSKGHRDCLLCARERRGRYEAKQDTTR